MAQYAGFPWRFLFTNLSTVTTTWANGLLTNREIHYILDQPTVISAAVWPDDIRVYLPWDDGYPRVAQTNRLIYAFRREAQPDQPPWVCRAAGILMAPEDEADPDVPLTHFSAYDAWQYMFARPIVDADGNPPPQATGYFIPGATGNLVATQILLNTIMAERTYGYAGNGTFIDAGDGSRIGEGDQYQNWGGTPFYTGTIEVTPAVNVTMQRGSTVGSIWQELCDVGNLDIVLRPIYDPINRPGYTHELSIYHLAGTERPEAQFSWGMLRRSASRIDRMHSALPGDYFNKGQYYAGSGGWPIPATGPLIPAPADIVTFGPYSDQQDQPQQTDTDPSGAATLSLLKQAITLAKQGKRTVTLDPTPERSPIPLLDYETGDRVPVYAPANRIRASVAGLQRVQEIPLQIPDDGPYEKVVGLIVAPQWRSETPPPPEGPRISYVFDGASTVTITVPTSILVGLDPTDTIIAGADDGGSTAGPWPSFPVTADPVGTYGPNLVLTLIDIAYDSGYTDYFVTPRSSVVFRCAVMAYGPDCQSPSDVIEPDLSMTSCIGPIVAFDYGVSATAESGPFDSLPLPHPVPAGGGGSGPSGGIWDWNAETATVDPSSPGLVTAWEGYAVGAGTYFAAAVAVQTAPSGLGAYNIATSEAITPVACPIPNGTKPGGSADLTLTVRQDSTDYDLNDVEYNSGTGKIDSAFGITVTPVGSAYETGPDGNNANAACFPLRSGPITIADVMSGSIDHPLHFTMPNCGPAPNPYPARPGSAGYPGNTGLPLGTWMRLDPGVDVPSLGLPSLETMICICLQKWGMFLRDIGSTLDIIAVDAINQGDPVGLWAAAGVTLTIPGVSGYNFARPLNGGMPWSSMQVLLPPAP